MGVPACRTGKLYDTYVEGNIRAALPHHCLTYLSDLAVSNCAYARFGKDAYLLFAVWKTELHDERKLPHPGFLRSLAMARMVCLGRCGWSGLTLECRQYFVRNSTRNKSWLWTPVVDKEGF